MKYRLGPYILLVCLLSSCISTKDKPIADIKTSSPSKTKYAEVKTEIIPVKHQQLPLKPKNDEQNIAITENRQKVNKRLDSSNKKVKITKKMDSKVTTEYNTPDIKIILFNKMYLSSILYRETPKKFTTMSASNQLTNMEYPQKVEAASDLIDDLIDSEIQTEKTINMLETMIDDLIIQEELFPELNLVKDNLVLRKNGKDDFEYSDLLIDEIIQKEKIGK